MFGQGHETPSRVNGEMRRDCAEALARPRCARRRLDLWRCRLLGLIESRGGSSGAQNEVGRAVAAGKSHHEVGPAILEHEGIAQDLALVAEALPIGWIANDCNAIRARPVLDRSGLVPATSMNDDVNQHMSMQLVQFPLDELQVAMTATAAHDDPHGTR
jgi:hypothetical protein